MGSVVIKSIDEAGVRRAVDAYAADILRTRPDVEEIVVFGSFAKGTWAPGSDVDLFIVLTAAVTPLSPCYHRDTAPLSPTEEAMNGVPAKR